MLTVLFVLLPILHLSEIRKHFDGEGITIMRPLQNIQSQGKPCHPRGDNEGTSDCRTISLILYNPENWCFLKTFKDGFT